jgi:hypothetical protein
VGCPATLLGSCSYPDNPLIHSPPLPSRCCTSLRSSLLSLFSLAALVVLVALRCFVVLSLFFPFAPRCCCCCPSALLLLLRATAVTFFALVSFLCGDHVPISVATLCHAQVLDVGGTGFLHVAVLGFGFIYSSIPKHLERAERRRELDLVGVLVAGRAEGFVGAVDYCHLIRPTYTTQCCVDTCHSGVCWHEQCAGLWRTSLHLLSDSKYLAGLRLD